jgi:hypothetical protein
MKHRRKTHKTRRKAQKKKKRAVQKKAQARKERATIEPCEGHPEGQREALGSDLGYTAFYQLGRHWKATD